MVMHDKVIVVLRDGTETTLENWQKMYGLKPGSDSIGRFFSLKDKRLAADIKEYGKLVVNELLIRVLDAYREATGEPAIINSFNRNDAKQKSLVEAGFRAAVFSPHVEKMASDVDTVSKEQTYKRVEILREVAAQLRIKIRIGFQEYLNKGQTFIHIDVCPEFYAPGKPYNQKIHPAAWEMAISW